MLLKEENKFVQRWYKMITAGLDIGLRSVKAVIFKNWERVGFAIAPAGNDHDRKAKQVLQKACKMAGLKKADIDYIVATGYGRRMISLADDTISEISANARGVKWLDDNAGLQTIIDLGGNDIKVIALDDDFNIQNFVMNDRYEAGMGRFIEELAKVLKIPIDEMSELSLQARNPVDFTSTGLELVKSDVGNLVVNGHKKEDLVAGIYRAVARKLVAMAKRVGIKGTVVFDGGPAKNLGMIKALEKELGMKIFVPENPQLVTATGATLIAAERLMKMGYNSNNHVS
jgi:predicted CoA-substrate-specific enzyme activase